MIVISYVLIYTVYFIQYKCSLNMIFINNIILYNTYIYISVIALRLCVHGYNTLLYVVVNTLDD